MAEVLDKTYQCMGCKSNIRLQRNDTNDGWIRYEMDGRRVHDCPAKKNKSPNSVGFARLESKIDVLTAEVKALRLEMQGLKK